MTPDKQAKAPRWLLKREGITQRKADELLDDEPREHRPYNCKCQSLKYKVLGDGCDECNPRLAEEIRRENEEEKP